MINLREQIKQQDVRFYRACLEVEEDFKSGAFCFADIFEGDNPHLFIRNLKFGRVLFKMFPELEGMSSVYQDKKRNQLLFDHSVKVLEFTYEQTPFPATNIAAFLHDIGKMATYDDKFKNHDPIGLKMTKEFLAKYGIGKETAKDVRVILTHHMRASQYQREPNWTDVAVKRFIKNTHPLTLETIKVARADKRASHDYAPYLEPYDELQQRCLGIFESRIDFQEY